MKKKMMFSMAAAMVALLFSVNFCWAEERDNSNFALIFEIGAQSVYLCEMSGSLAYNGPVTQGTIGVSHEPTGVYVAVWGSIPFEEGFRNSAGSEIDYLVGIEREIGPFIFELRYGFYDVAEMGKIKGDFHSFFFSENAPNIISLWKIPVTPFVSFEYIKGTDEDIIEGGWMWQGGISFDLKEIIKIPHAESFDLKLTAGGNDGVFGSESQLLSFGRATIVAGFPLPEAGLTMSPFISLQEANHVENGNGAAVDKVWVGLTISF